MKWRSSRQVKRDQKRNRKSFFYFMSLKVNEEEKKKTNE